MGVLTGLGALLPLRIRATGEPAASQARDAASYRRVVEQSPDAYVSVDDVGGVTEWNPAAEAVFGWRREEVLGRNLGDLVLSVRMSAVHRREIEEFAATRTSPIIGRRSDVPMTARDGRRLRVDCVVWSVTDEQGRSTLHTFMTDVTARRETAETLRRADDDLATFAAAMAHDLRVPLTVIKGYLELLDHELDRGSAAAGWVARLDAAADRGVALVDDILGYLGLGRVLAVHEPVDLGDLLAEVVAEQRLAADREVRAEVGPLPVVDGDRRLLSQLFGNLVGNAVKHVPPDRTVEVVVDAVAPGPPGEVVVRVSDNGDTIPLADRERIFAMFDRGSVTPAGAGSGIGLAVSRRVAELHHGGITVEAAPGGGTTFCVRLGGSDG